VMTPGGKIFSSRLQLMNIEDTINKTMELKYIFLMISEGFDNF